MLLLKKIIINSFLSHELTSIEFSPHENILIDGVSGSGKSSIFEAIIFALYGVGRSDGRSMIKKGQKEAIITLHLTQQERTFIIIRSITLTGKHDLSIIEEGPDGKRWNIPIMGIREKQKFIEKELTGASYLLFINSVAYLQGNADSFVSQTAPKRKELLLEIVNAESYKKYYENARKKVSELENEMNRYSGMVSALNARRDEIFGYNDHLVDHKIRLNEDKFKLSLVESDIVMIEKKKDDLTIMANTFEMLRSRVSEVENMISSIDSSIESKKERLSNRDELEKATASLPEEEARLFEIRDELSGVRKELALSLEMESKRRKYLDSKPKTNDYSQKIDELSKDISFLKKEVPCPSGDDCPYYSRVSGSIAEKESLLMEAVIMADKEQRLVSEWERGRENFKELDIRSFTNKVSFLEEKIHTAEQTILRLKEMKNTLDQFSEISSDIERLKKEKDGLISALSIVKKKADEVQKTVDSDALREVKERLTARMDEKSRLIASIASSEMVIKSIQEREKELSGIEEKISNINDSVGKIKSDLLSLSIVKDAFGSRGVETIVIDYLIPRLEDKINAILSKLSEYRVRIDTQRKSADGESIIEGLFITILNESSEEMSFESYSGGEKLKISVAISESLATLQKVGFRLFDEVFVGLDENSTESFSDVLRDLQRDFSQVLCISHLPQIKEQLDKKIIVCKNNGTSYVK